MRRLHLIVGLLGIVAFLLTGQYMDRVHAHLDGMADGPRMIYRSAHIYLLFASLLNVFLGGYFRSAAQRNGRILQWMASAAILVLPVLFLLAFFREPSVPDLVRPWARPAIYLSLFAVPVHVLGYWAAGDARDVAGSGIRTGSSA
jgi:hypothetical protein